MIWAADTHIGGAVLERHLSILAILPVAYWGVNTSFNREQIRAAFVGACVAVVPLYFFTLFWAFNHSCIDSANQALPVRWMPIAYFANGISVIKHRLFLSSIEILGIIIACYRRKWLCACYGNTAGWLIVCVEVGLMAALILATGSRASLFTGVALIGVSLIDHAPKKYKPHISLSALLLVIIMSLAIIELHPRMQTFSWEQLRIEEMDSQRNARLNIWAMALDTPDDFLAHGIGVGQSPAYLQEKYRHFGYESYEHIAQHAHNQYLTELIELGVPGLLLFLLAWGSLMLVTKGHGRQTTAYLVTLFGMNMLTDNMFGRYDGVAVWCFWLLMIMLEYPPFVNDSLLPADAVRQDNTAGNT